MEVRHPGFVLALGVLLLVSACSSGPPRSPTGAGAQVSPGDDVSPSTDEASIGAPDAEGSPTGRSGKRGTTSRGTISPTTAGTPTGSSSGTAGTGGTAQDGSPVAFSYIAGFSGPYGPIIREALKGLYAWRDDVNARGGIHGRQVVVREVDHGETADGGVAACKEVLSNGSVLAFGAIGIEAVTTATDCLDEAGFPTLYFASAKPFYAQWRHSYAVTAHAEELGASLASFVQGHLKHANRKLGVIHVDGLQFRYTAEAYVREARALGMDVVRVTPVAENQASFVSELIRMRDDGVTNVALFVGAEVVGILRDARTIGYAPHFTGTYFTFDFLGVAARDLMKDVTGLRIFATTESPAFREFTAKSDRYGYRNRVTDGDHFFTYGYGLVIGRVLEAADASMTKPSMFRGVESIKGYDNHVMAPITWGPGDHVGTMQSFPVVCCQSNWHWKSLGPPAERY